MGLANQDVPHGVELNPSRRPKRDHSAGPSRTLFLSSLTMLTYCVVLELMWDCQIRWPGSPLFVVLGFLLRLATGVLVFLVGLVVMIVSAKCVVIKASWAVISESGWSLVLCPTAFALVVSYLVFRTGYITRVSETTQWILAALMAIVWFVCLGADLFDGSGAWVEEIKVLL